MNRIDDRLACIVIGMLLGILLVLTVTPTIPRCEEDQVLVGSGQFAHGQWSAYNCGPVINVVLP